MNRATTIQEVINQLDSIIENAVKRDDRLGLFAYVYRRTTAEILKEVQLGNFENNELLEQLDVVFANLYLDAYIKYQRNEPVRKSWQFAFVETDNSLSILQHIMLGMNAHINLDLAIATSDTMTGKDIESVRNDFDKVNDILFGIVNEIQDRLSRVSPLLFLLDWAGKNSDEKVIDFSMRKARQQSWNSANLLWGLGAENQSGSIDIIDKVTLELGKMMAAPKSRFIRFLLKAISRFESKNVGQVISKLRAD
ncbi:DUF5995 family protein [Winogradskyella bathintestinalis]|uniref:DUF5995 family protein n=1 Tax=Winogradskyella bathintestinalis TaxID=3035208 RepID=A0ABT7ZU28_9FLAO|nr:DUF5995 family protein [Winogradskyella bathintestinalis]MDN3492513.1 DUF5995 family protein [Winogradskyella bathintestinalis]